MGRKTHCVALWRMTVSYLRYECLQTTFSPIQNSWCMTPKYRSLTGDPTIKENHVIAVVHVTVKATRHAPGNVEFL